MSAFVLLLVAGSNKLTLLNTDADKKLSQLAQVELYTFLLLVMFRIALEVMKKNF